MSTLLRLLPTLLLLLLRGARRSPPAAPAAAPEAAAPVNFVNFADREKADAAPADEPDGFVPHAWADRAEPQEGRL